MTVATSMGLLIVLTGALVVAFTTWLYRQPVPEGAAWEQVKVTALQAVCGLLLIAGGGGLAWAGTADPESLSWRQSFDPDACLVACAVTR